MSDTSEVRPQNSRATSLSSGPETCVTSNSTVTEAVPGTSGIGSSRTNTLTSGAANSTDFNFIQSPLKRQYFRDNLVQTHSHKGDMTLSDSNEADSGNGSRPTSTETAFTPPAPVITYDHGVKAQIVSPNANVNTTKTTKTKEGPLNAQFVREESERPYQPTTTPLYTKTQFSSIEKFIGSSTAGSGSGSGSAHDPEKENAPEYKMQYLPDDNVQEALLAFLLSTFNLVFSAGIGYWHLSGGLNNAGYNTFVILIVGGLFMKLAFIFNRDIKVWKECKPIFLLCIIPFFTAFSLSFADFIFTAKVAKNKSYVRPWTNTRMVYLVESLALAFPQCVYQSMLMVEDPQSLITVKGMVILIGLGILVYGMAFARIRYDSAYRPHRFGSGLDKILRSLIIGSHKGLWVVTYVCALVAARKQFPDSPCITVIITIGVLLLSLELAVLISTFKLLESLVMRFSWMFFMIPQCVFLVALIYWVNVDPALYDTNVGVCLLGAASMFESIVLMGWLLDTCNDRDPDIMAAYPHFLGDLWSRKDKNQLLDS